MYWNVKTQQDIIIFYFFHFFFFLPFYLLDCIYCLHISFKNSSYCKNTDLTDTSPHLHSQTTAQYYMQYVYIVRYTVRLPVPERQKTTRLLFIFFYFFFFLPFYLLDCIYCPHFI